MESAVVQTWLTERFGVRVPVVSAPMAGVAGGELAAAVSGAGGLGMIGVGARTPAEWIGPQCERAADAGAAFGVGLQAWALSSRPDQLEAAIAGRPALMSVSYGPYKRYLPTVQRAGIPVATTVGTLAEAEVAQRAGVDLLVVRGAEGGGHGRNDVATLPLLQAVLDKVSIPVLAAGGIGSARGLAAVLAAGAAGAWCGTAFLTCVEGTTTSAFRARLAAATDTDTVYGRVFDLARRAEWPAEFGERALRNPFFDRWVGLETDITDGSPAAREMASAQAADDMETVCVDAGQGVALLGAEVTAAEVVRSFAGAGELLGRFGPQQ